MVDKDSKNTAVGRDGSCGARRDVVDTRVTEAVNDSRSRGGGKIEVIGVGVRGGCWFKLDRSAGLRHL